MNMTDEAIECTTIECLHPGVAILAMDREDQKVLSRLREECNSFLRMRLRALRDEIK